MTHMQESQDEDIKQLKALIAEVRDARPRRPFSSDVRARVLGLWRAGVPIPLLSQKLGLAASMIYTWGKQPSSVVPGAPAPAVLQVEPRVTEAAQRGCAALDGALHLSLGGFVITIARAET